KTVSSTRIRTLAALGEDVSAFTGEKIAQYIIDRGLYFMPEVAGVKKLLKPERWAHTVRVAVMAAEHCVEAGVSEKTAIAAAALHDCAKNLSADDELL
ncbi:MAG: HD domain-containing protein, partial [Clostridia bacterium]|nr:HD domain-containing protein [Clostridia bacterium]